MGVATETPEEQCKPCDKTPCLFDVIYLLLDMDAHGRCLWLKIEEFSSAQKGW